MNKQMPMPQSRVDQLVIQEVLDDTLVYDLDRHKAHCLNSAAAFVWSQCDGETSVREVSQRLSERTGLPADEKIVYMALRQLDKARLLETDAPIPVEALQGGGRRELLKRIGLIGVTATLLPVITSIVAPTPAAAFTCFGSGASCTSSAQCCSGLCVGLPGPGTCA